MVPTGPKNVSTCREQFKKLNIIFMFLWLLNRSWAPGHSDIIFDFDYTLKTKTGELNGTDYLHLFNAIRKVDTFSEWMGTHFYNTLQKNASPDNMEYEQLLDRIELDGVTIDECHTDAAVISRW